MVDKIIRIRRYSERVANKVLVFVISTSIVCFFGWLATNVITLNETVNMINTKMNIVQEIANNEKKEDEVISSLMFRISKLEMRNK